jgi:hypothetical protein
MRHSYNGESKAIVASTANKYTFGDTIIPNGQLKKIEYVTTGANNHLNSAVSHNRVFIASSSIYDTPSSHLRAVAESEYPSKIYPPNSRLRWTVPFDFPSAHEACKKAFGLDKINMGIPGPLKVTSQVEVGTGASTGTIRAGFKTTLEPINVMPKLLSFAGNVTPNNSKGVINLSVDDGIVYGIVIPLGTLASGIDTISITLSGVPVFEGDHEYVLEEAFEVNPQSVATPIFLRMPEALPAITGRSKIEIKTLAAVLQADQWSLLTLHKVGA